MERTDKKLTDAEVKKALEWHLNEVNHCDGCPLFVLKNTTTYCVDVLMQNALDLINRQSSRIEKLEKVEHFADKTIESLKAEVERLNNNISAMSTTLSTSARATRHEAYKELAEKVKSEARYFAANVPDVCEVIDNLLNELVGDDNSHNIDKQN